MQRRESEFTTKFKRWVYHEWTDDQPAYFELKVSREKSIPFGAVSDKQNLNLKIRKFVHKFSDFDRMGTPFDMICFTGNGFVVIHYYRPRNKEFFIVPIDDFLKEKASSSRKSLTEDRARELFGSYFLK